MPLASQNYRSGQPISEYIQNNLAPHFSPNLINPQHFCHSARRKPVRLSKSGLGEPTVDWAREARGPDLSGFAQRALADQHFMCCAECIEPGRDSTIGCRMQQGSFDLLDSNAVVERAFNVQLDLRRPVQGSEHS